MFLRNSCAAYDHGCKEEAVRIAVVIRVLCHDTKMSNSLLSQLGVKQTLQFVTTAATLPEGMENDFDFGDLLKDTTIGHDIFFTPVQPDNPTISSLDWWEQDILIRDKIFFSRKHVVLAAANKDGGAHVDTPDAKLKAFRESAFHRTVKNPDGTTSSIPLENNHFRVLRRLADELLNSEELLRLSVTGIGA